MIKEVESDIWKLMFKIECLTLQRYVDLQGIADFVLTLEYKGQVLKQLAGLNDNPYVSVFGEITISRTNLRDPPNTKTSARPTG